MTDGDAERTEPWIKKMGVEFAYGFDRTYPWIFAYNMWVYPRCILVNSSGVVVWQGHPKDLDEKVLRQHLRGALRSPIFEWPAFANPVVELIRAHRYQEAKELAAFMARKNANHSSLADDVQKLVEARVAGLEAAHRVGDFATLVARATATQEMLGALPEAKRISPMVDKIFEDPDKLMVWNAQTQVRAQAINAPQTTSEARARLKKVEELAKQHPGTIVSQEARQARAMLSHLKRALESR